MKASKFSDARKAYILKQCADGIPVVIPDGAIGSEAARHRFKGKPNVPILLVKPDDAPRPAPGVWLQRSSLGWPD